MTKIYAMPILSCTVFVSAFLLFSMEPFIGRQLTPLFGGSVHVWLVCLSFYQLMLLIGYLYAYWAAKTKGRFFIISLFLPLVSQFFPFPEVIAHDSPFAAIIAILLSRFAVPFILLSVSTIVAQEWLARINPEPEPYRLYRISNAGALLALVAYSTVIEPLAGLHFQSIIWKGGYVLFVLLMMFSYKLTVFNDSGNFSNTLNTLTIDERQGVSTKHFIYSAFLSAVTSALLTTVTQVLASDMGSFPLIWILPLGLYLISFIVAFDGKELLPRALIRFYPEIFLSGMFLYFINAGHYIVHVGHLLFFFTTAVVIHRILYDRRPHPSKLSGFYIAIALGGATGSLGAALFAPLLFSSLLEYPFLMFLSLFIFCMHHGKRVLSLWHGKTMLMRAARLIPMVILLTLIFVTATSSSPDTLKASKRNYFGISRVIDGPVTVKDPVMVRTLIHGATIHGLQYLDAAKKDIPTLYYHDRGGLADALAAMPPKARFAAIGLGAGTLAAYGKPGNTIIFYEINPAIDMLAKQWFTFLDHSSAEPHVIIGDGRLSMQHSANREPPYDMIFVDAFNGEGIPTHLLTKEALGIYLNRLTADGIILFHTSNRYYDLRPVLKANATELHLLGATKTVTTKRIESAKPICTEYVALTRSQHTLWAFINQNWVVFGPDDGIKLCRPWSDDYVNILYPLFIR
ncbi:MAG: hypothetical protein CSYNP_02393 [Syntrophus sp. SKADARSKE-3]|nr:hypothetical protein [Syntrophus sp. SKADARSKE-3]